MARRPIPSLKHLTLKQVRLVRLFLLLALFSVLVLYAVFRSQRFQEAMRRKTERLLSAQIGRKVSIGGFDLALLPFSFVVKDVAIANDRRSLAGPLFSASEIEIRGVPGITSDRIELSKLRVVAPRVVVEVFPDGSTNVDAVLQALRGAAGGGKDVQLHEAVIQRASLRFREWSAEIDALLKDAAVTARAGRTLSVTQLALACRQGSFRLENNETLDFAIGAEVTLAPGRVHLTGLRLRGPKVTLDAEGGVDDLKKPVLALALKAETTGETLGRAFGLGLPLTGPVRLNGSLRVGDPGGLRIRAGFDLPASRLAVFPMSGEGTLRLDPKGLVVEVTRANYAGGTLEALVRLDRLDRPPLPVKIALRGSGIDFEQFFADIGLPGTGFMARAGLDATLTFGPGGIEHADGLGRLTLAADPGRASAVRGRVPIPVSGGGPIRIRDGRIGFEKMPLATAGGAKVRLDGTLRFGSWEPDLTFDAAATDRAELERIASDWYPAIQGEPLEPPLGLAGAGRVTARLSRTFGDPKIEGRLEATDFVLRGARFGEASGAFTVDRNVATLAPFEAKDGGGSLVLEGKIGFGGALHGHYRLDGLVGDFHDWPLERVLAFLDLDLPLAGRATGRLPLDGTTPAIHGRVPLVLKEASVWGQKLDRLEGVLAFQDDRIAVEGAVGSLGSAAARGDGSYRYADGRYRFSLEAKDLPLSRVGALSGQSFEGTLTGRTSGEGVLDRPTLVAEARVAGATWDGRPLGRPGRDLEVRVRADAGAWSLRAEAAEEGMIELLSPKEGAGDLWRGRAEIASLAPLAPLLGLSPDAGFDGRISAQATLKPGPADAGLEGEMAISAAQVRAFGRTLSLRGGTTLRLANGRVAFEHLTFAEAPRTESPAAAVTSLAFSGSVQLAAPHALDVAVTGAVDAALLRAAVDPLRLAGRITVDARLGGTASAPVVTGRAALDGVDVLNPEGTAFLEGATGSLLFTEGRITVSDLTVRYGGGSVDLGGSLTLDGWKPSGMRITALVSRVKASPFDGFRATFSGNLLLLGDTAPRSVRGELVFDRALYDRDFSIDLSSLLQRKRVAVVGANPTALDAVTLDVRLVAPPESIEVRTNVARLRASGELFARGTWGHPILFGEIRAEEGGRLILQGQRYDLVTARILFSNPIRIEPFFDLEARGTISKYQVTFGLTGTASRLAPRFSSDPQLSEAEIVSLMATGDVPSTSVTGGPIGPAPASSDESVSKAARELLATLASDAVTSRTREFFRLDRFQIDPAFSTGSTFDAPRITVGKSLGKDFNATVSFVLSSNQQQIITLDYELSSTAFLQARLDEFGVYSLELRFRQRLR